MKHSRFCLVLENNETLLGVDGVSSLASTPHVPRFFVMRRDGTGYELLRHEDVGEYLKAAEDDAATAVLRTPVEGLPGVTGITVLKPFPGNTCCCNKGLGKLANIARITSTGIMIQATWKDELLILLK